MKKRFAILILLFICSVLTRAQKTECTCNRFKEGQVDLGAFRTRILTTKFYGFNFDLKIFPGSRLATGLYFTASQKNVSGTFTYSIGKPQLQYYEAGWINQYNFMQTVGVRMNLNLLNGISIARLGDNTSKERRSTRYGHIYVAKKIAANYDYLLPPGADVSVKVFRFNHSPDVWITTKSKYRLLFGRDQFGTRDQFSGFLFDFGISLIGFAIDAGRPGGMKQRAF